MTLSKTDKKIIIKGLQREMAILSEAVSKTSNIRLLKVLSVKMDNVAKIIKEFQE
jgi:hypothetical protein